MLSDPLAGLEAFTFPLTVDLGQSYSLDGATQTTLLHSYAFSAASTFSATTAVTATDRAKNQTTQPFSVVHDTLPLLLTVTVPPTVPLRFSVAWSGLDNLSGIREYNVRYKVGAMGAWQGWLTNTLQSEAQFSGIPDGQYYFEVTATDNVNNSTVEQVGPITVKSVTKYYTHGGTKVAMRRGAGVYYLHGDHLGSTSLTTDQDQTIVSEARYLPYGQERWSGGETPTDFGFTSQRNERGFGLYDYNARYYSAVLGRFVSPDSIVPEPGSSGGFNRYRYTRNNPLKYTDPSGHIECTGGVSSTMKRTYCIGGGTIEIGSTGGGSGLEVAAMFLMALTIKLVQNNIALDDVEVPTDSGGYGNDQGSQFPAYEEVPLDGPIDDGVLPNVPPKVPGLNENGIFDEFVAPVDWPIVLESRINFGRNNRDFEDVFVNGNPIRGTRRSDIVRNRGLLDDLAGEYSDVEMVGEWQHVYEWFEDDDYEYDLHWFENKDRDGNIYIERGKVDSIQ